MAARRTIIQTVILAAFVVLSLPAMAAAQGNSPWWGNRDDRRDRRDDWRFTRLRDSVRRVDSLADRFQSELDRALDRSRVDGSRREDRINDQARDFNYAASRLRNSLGDGRYINNSADEARHLLRIGSRIDVLMRRFRLDRRTEATWAQIRQELRVIENAYDGGYGRGGGGGRWPY